ACLVRLDEVVGQGAELLVLPECAIPGYMYESDFFFQAEDGIRDGHVTGVQTCALPILESIVDDSRMKSAKHAIVLHTQPAIEARSEERRVGKECRCPWSRYSSTKKEHD